VAAVGYVYLMRVGEYHKIGSSADPYTRLAHLASGPLAPEVVHRIASRDRFKVENALQRRFAASRVRGEWFRLNDAEVAMIRKVGECHSPDDLPEELAPPRPRSPRPRGRPPKRRQGRNGKPVQFYVSEELGGALRAYRDAQRMVPGISDVIRVALEDFLQREGFWPPKG